ncbi:hypothetical protein BDV19DRAFT_364020 [Aspergillus venezuelensis]
MYPSTRCLSRLNCRRGRHRHRHRRRRTRGLITHNRSRRSSFPLSSLSGMVFPCVTVCETEAETHFALGLLGGVKLLVDDKWDGWIDWLDVGGFIFFEIVAWMVRCDLDGVD